jgi:hypothetical protein
MYQQPVRGPEVPHVIRHIFLAKPAPRTRAAVPVAKGILAELAELGRH